MRIELKFPLRIAGALALGAALGCSLIVDFDPEGKPCDEKDNYSCLEGFLCVDDGGKPICSAKGDLPPYVPPAKDYQCGTVRCQPTQGCLASRNECVEKICGATACKVGEHCVAEGGVAQCVPVPSKIGKPCIDDSACDAGHFCLISSVLQPITNARVGFCTKMCGGPGDCVAADGMTAGCFQVGVQQSMCLPTSDAAAKKPIYFTCSREADCKDFPGFTCALFDNKPDLTSSSSQRIEIPPQFCDKARDSQVVETMQPCSPFLQSEQQPKNGLCLPGHTFDKSLATELCRDDADCPSGICRPSEYIAPIPGYLPRRLQACVKEAKFCKTCVRDGDCEVDAPHCVKNKYGEQFCANECKSVLINGSMLGIGCGAGVSCETSGAAATYCMPRSCSSP